MDKLNEITIAYIKSPRCALVNEQPRQLSLIHARWLSAMGLYETLEIQGFKIAWVDKLADIDEYPISPPGPSSVRRNGNT